MIHRSAVMNIAWAVALVATWPVVIILLCAGALGYVAYTSQYTWAEMDWNSDGSTRPGEILASLDIGSTTVGDCVEYFSYKDGLPVKLICPAERT